MSYKYSKKMIVCCGPSGSGKSTLVKHLVDKQGLQLEFSVSATSRDPRRGETNGKEYYFVSAQTFKSSIKQGDFVEYEEVYKNLFYGTLYKELERIWNKGKHIIFDIDVLGATQLKKKFKEQCLTIFVAPPSIQILEERLLSRHTESKETLKTRIERAQFEMSEQNKFDKVIINDTLSTAKQQIVELVTPFLEVS